MIIQLPRHQAEAILGAMRAVAQDGGLPAFTEADRATIDAAATIVFGLDDVDMDALSTIAPEGLARELASRENAEQAMRMLAVMSLADGVQDPEKTARMRAYADALGIHDGYSPLCPTATRPTQTYTPATKRSANCPPRVSAVPAFRDDGYVERSPVAIVNPIDVEETPSWLRTMVATFLDDPGGPSVERWARVMARTWDPARAWGARDRGRWVATLRTETRTLTVPGTNGGTRDLRADAVTNLTVSATHRRRGLMRQMLDGALCAARARGDAVSILISAEWPIYGRFGYAPATWSADYVLHRNRRGAVPAGDAARVRASDAQEIAAVGAGVFSAFRRQRAGQVDRDQRWWDIALGQDGFPAPPEDAGLPHNWIVHEGDDGIDGIVGWRATRQGGLNPPGGRAEVWGLFAVNNAADRDLWAYVSGIDLIDEIALPHRPVDEPARWLLADGRSLVLEDRNDYLWLRILDVPTALIARRYAIAGELVLDVRDDAPATEIDVSGRYALRAGDDTVECQTTDRPADLELTQRALASIYLGGVRPAELVRSGALTERTPGALERTRLMFSTPQPPWNATGF